MKTSKASPQKSPLKSQAERVEFARQAFRSSLFVFAKECLGYDRLYDVHRPWCHRAEDLLHGFLERREGYTRRAMTLEPRGTYKSTILDVAFVLWALVHNPNLRILIISASYNNATNFLREVKQHVQTNRKFRTCFGKWDRETDAAREWSENAIIIADRTEVKKEPSVLAVGRGTEATSMHFDIAIVDDLVTREDRDSVATRKASKTALKDLEAIMEPESLVHVIGTHWHYDDAYMWIRGELNRDLRDQAKQQWQIQLGTVYEEDGLTPRFERIIPDVEDLKIKRGLVDFYANYLNNPLPPDTQLFGEESLSFFDYDVGTYKPYHKVGYWDPASTRQQKGKDPDFHCIPVLAQHPDGTLDVIDVWMKQEKPAAGYAACETLAKSYDLGELRVELNHLPDAEDNLEEQFRKKNIRTAVSGVKNTVAKDTRIAMLEPLTSAGRIRFRRDWREASQSYRLFMEQLTMYPVAAHDDGPDALEGAYQTIHKGTPKPVSVEGPKRDEDEERTGQEEEVFSTHEIESIWNSI